MRNINPKKYQHQFEENVNIPNLPMLINMATHVRKLFLRYAGKKYNLCTSHQWKDVNSSSPHDNIHFHDSQEFSTHNHNKLA
jgi:hypothetical protein